MATDPGTDVGVIDGAIEEEPELTGDLGLSRTVEALLFVSDRAITMDEIRSVTGAPPLDIEAALLQLRETYSNRGIRIVEHRGTYRMVSAPEAATHCRKLLGLETRPHLSRAALEVLGVIAYQQPVTRAQIEAIRGVDSDSSLATLLARGLIEEVDRLEAPGRPMLFATTDLFLAHFGISSIDTLPEIDFPPASDIDSTRPEEEESGD